MYEMRTYNGATRTTHKTPLRKTAKTNKKVYANVFDRLANYLEEENKKREKNKQKGIRVMKEYEIVIFDDVNEKYYEKVVKATNMIKAENIVITECIALGFHIDRIFTRERV